MAKVFTITEGVENLGALKSGGQGSVYKARRNGGIITAIKILPTPIASESEEDKHFASFQNEVKKLQKVNERRNPNVVGIIDSGITTSGNLPYIEMEYIDGPDLGELLKPPHKPVFTIEETIKVATDLANALAHCHQANIKHGDIKSNNIKFNQQTGNYMLLDFGLSVMSDEQRRTSIRYAGAIEFMAPEQSNGETLFETDVYSYGIVLYELLAGTVPFPLVNKGERARNEVMLAHMESLPPDIINLRRNVITGLWDADTSEKEMHIPLWLLLMIDKCLEKNPGKRFSNGIRLKEYIDDSIQQEKNTGPTKPAESAVLLPIDEFALRNEIEKLKTKLEEKEELLSEMRVQADAKERELNYYRHQSSRRTGVSRSLFAIVLIMALGAGGLAAYDTFLSSAKKTTDTKTPEQPVVQTPLIADSSLLAEENAAKINKIKPVKYSNTNPGNTENKPPKKKTETPSSTTGNEYTIVKDTYFYKAPDKNSRSDIYLTAGDATLTLLDEKNEFAYVLFVNDDGEKTKGWILKKDFVRINDY